MVDATIVVNASQTFDCKLARYIPNPDSLGDGSEKERQKAVFELEDKASLKNCIIGAASGTEGSADGVHCTGGGCDVTNVWFEDVGEDAITFYVTGGGDKKAADKVMQFNGKGTATIKNFWVDTFTRFIRTCGNWNGWN
uniref:Probable pectate lyase F n=1 Tax=Ditylenchus dipsaci TaxID=166011 RepID=A0A915DSW2_9BILA